MMWMSQGLYIFTHGYFFTLTIISGAEFECFQYSDPLTDDQTMYRLKERGEWKNRTCRTGTLWNREQCYCAIDRAQEDTHNEQLQKAHCNNFQEIPGEPTKYKRLVSGDWKEENCTDFDPSLVWDQIVCQCVQNSVLQQTINVDPDSTACDTMFDSCFDTENEKYYITTKDPQGLRIVDDVQAYNGKAVLIDQKPLLLPLFKQNELAESFQIYVRFKLQETPRRDLVDMYQVIFSDKCDNHSATISCSYKPKNFSYRLVLQNGTQSVPVVQECSYEAGDRFTSWKNVYILHQDGEIIMAVNGKPCLQFEFTGYPKFKCDLAIGGYPSTYKNGTTDEINLLGYVDVMSVDRNCRSPIP